MAGDAGPHVQHLSPIRPDFQEDHPISGAVITAVADAEGISPLDVHPPLATVIDPDALDALFQSEAWDGQVTFTYRGYEILVRADGTVVLYPTDE